MEKEGFRFTEDSQIKGGLSISWLTRIELKLSVVVIDEKLEDQGALGNNVQKRVTQAQL